MNLLQVFGEKQFPDWLRVVDIRPVQWACVCADDPTITDELTEEQYKASASPRLAEQPQRAARGIHPSPARRGDQRARDGAESREISYLLQGTDLIATLPERLVTAMNQTVPVKIFPLPMRVTETREVLVWHKRNEPDPGHAWLRDILVEVAREP